MVHAEGYRALNKSQSAPSAYGGRKDSWLDSLNNLGGKVRRLFKFLSAVDPEMRDGAIKSHLSPTPSPAPTTMIQRAPGLANKKSLSTPMEATTALHEDDPRPSLQHQHNSQTLGKLATIKRNLRSMFSGIIRDGNSKRDSDVGLGLRQSPTASASNEEKQQQRLVIAQQPDRCGSHEGQRLLMGDAEITEDGGNMVSISRNVALLRVPTLAAKHRDSNVIAVCEDLPQGDVWQAVARILNIEQQYSPCIEFNSNADNNYDLWNLILCRSPSCYFRYGPSSVGH